MLPPWKHDGDELAVLPPSHDVEHGLGPLRGVETAVEDAEQLGIALLVFAAEDDSRTDKSVEQGYICIVVETEHHFEVAAQSRPTLL